MPVIIDSYSETNGESSTAYSMASNLNQSVGQAFTGNDGQLISGKAYLYKGVSPTGNFTASIYAETHATAFGTDSKPTGSALATSDNVDATTLGSGFANASLIIFNFSGANQITLTNGTNYIFILTYTNTASAAGSISWVGDSSSPTASGNVARTTNSGSSWTADATTDLCFYLYSPDLPIATTAWLSV